MQRSFARVEGKDYDTKFVVIRFLQIVLDLCLRSPHHRSQTGRQALGDDTRTTTEMAKFESLKRSYGGAFQGDGRRDRLRQEKEDFIATWSWPDENLVRHYGLSNAEIVGMYDRRTGMLAAQGIVKPTPGHDSVERTWQYFGWHMIRNGWCPIPQQRGFQNEPGDLGEAGLVRKPAPIPTTSANGKHIEFAFKPTLYRKRLMPLFEFLSMHRYRGVNVALQCCESSMHIRGLDIDCRSWPVAQRVYELAVEHLGDTPFVRVGQLPKMMLIYRVEGEEDIAIGKYTYRLLNSDGSENLQDGSPQNAVEYLSDGSLITAYGLHHKTGETFHWGELHPAIAGPQQAPVITKAQLRAFEVALQNEFKLKGSKLSISHPHGGEAAVTEFSRVDGRIWMPKVAIGDFILDDEGYVIEGGEDWLRAQTWAACGANTDMLENEAAYKDLEARTIQEAIVRLTKHKRSNAALLSASRIELETKVKLHTSADKWRASLAAFRRDGRYHNGVLPFRILQDGRRPIVRPIAGCGDLPTDGSLDWLPRHTALISALAEHRPRTPWSPVAKSVEQIALDRAARDIIPLAQRQAVADGVSENVTQAVRGWFARTIESLAKPDGTVIDPVDVPFEAILAPTGAGKTRQAIDIAIAELMSLPRRENEGPALLVVPTHDNATEALTAVDAWSDEEIEALAKAIDRPDFRVATFKGREAMKCQQIEKLKLLSEKRIGVSGLCKADVPAVDEITASAMKRDGEKVPMKTILCEFRERGECGYYNQWHDIETADLVIVTHAYLTQHTLPKPLINPRMVIIDESVTSALLAQARFPISSLRLVRKEPYVTKKDRTQFPEMSTADISRAIHGERQVACGLAEEWLLAGKDVAAEFVRRPDGLTLVDSAIIVGDRAHEVERAIRPDMTLEQVQKETSKEVAQDLLLEIRFWKIVRERILQLQADAEATGQANCVPQARGPRDMRIQMVWQVNPKAGKEEPNVRISWRVTPNWADRPTLLLDASANPRVLGKLFGRQPRMHRIPAPLHVRTVAMIERTWSNSSFIPRNDATRDEIAACANTVREARSLITVMAGLYGYGRVLVGATLAVRETLTKGGWAPPANVDFCHYGALRGIDRWKHHVCAISLGRSEMPISVIDGYRAALTYDDLEPEEPYDKHGNGLGDDGKPLFRKPAERVMTMRDGRDISHFVPEMPGKIERDENGKPQEVRSWAQEVEESWREEELRQFLGRLRPVYRGIAHDDAGELMDVEPPVWIAVGKIQPDEIVVDEVVEMPQLIKAAPFYELARRTGGVLAADIVQADPACADVLQGRSLLELVAALLPPSLTSPYVKRMVSGAALVKYRTADGRTPSGMVFPAMTENGVEAAMHAAAAEAGVEVEVISVTPAARKPIAKSVMVEDKFEKRTSSRREIRQGERNLRFVWLMMPADQRPSFDETEMLLLRGERVCGLTLSDLLYELEPPEPGMGDPEWTDDGDERIPMAPPPPDVQWWHVETFSRPDDVPISR